MFITGYSIESVRNVYTIIISSLGLLKYFSKRIWARFKL